MGQGHYICDVLDYSTVTWWKCDDEIITKYPGYPLNVYDELECNNNNKTKSKRHDMDGSDSIVSIIYIRKIYWGLELTCLLLGCQEPKIWNIFWREKLILNHSKTGLK